MYSKGHRCTSEHTRAPPPHNLPPAASGPTAPRRTAQGRRNQLGPWNPNPRQGASSARRPKATSRRTSGLPEGVRCSLLPASLSPATGLGWEARAPLLGTCCGPVLDSPSQTRPPPRASRLAGSQPWSFSVVGTVVFSGGGWEAFLAEDGLGDRPEQVSRRGRRGRSRLDVWTQVWTGVEAGV